MRPLFLLPVLLLPSLSFASSISVELPLETPRAVDGMLEEIFDDRDEDAVEAIDDDGVRDLREMAAHIPHDLGLVREITTREGAHIEWDTGNEGERFVRFRAGPQQAYAIVPNDVGEILQGAHIPGSPYFYFVVIDTNGHRSLYLFDFRGRFMLLKGFGRSELEVVETGLFEDTPEHPFIVIRLGDNLRAFVWIGGETVPVLCPDLEEGMTIRRVGRVVGIAPPQTFWIVDIDQNPRLFIDSDEADMNEWALDNNEPRRKVPVPVVEEQTQESAVEKKSAVTKKKKGSFKFPWQRDKK